MHEALLYESLPKQKVRCHVCQRECTISAGKEGFCQTRINKNGRLYTTIYGLVSSLNNDPIEKKPVFHFQPGSSCLSLGTYGCNFRCQFCQNWEITHTIPNLSLITSHLSPKKVVQRALEINTSGIAITYNEPAVWLEYSLDVFKLAKAKTSLYTCWVTNGYATKETIDTIAPYLNVYRVDLKSFDDGFYQKLIKIPKAEGVFEVTKYVKNKYPEIHIECVTNIIPGWNDDSKMLGKIAKWISQNLGLQTPWHVTRFYPAANMLDTPPTPPETLTQAQKIGLRAGLEFVYLGNLPTETGENTYCPKCKKLVVRRSGYSTQMVAVSQEGKCKFCHKDLNIRV